MSMVATVHNFPVVAAWLPTDGAPCWKRKLQKATTLHPMQGSSQLVDSGFAIIMDIECAKVWPAGDMETQTCTTS